MRIIRFYGLILYLIAFRFLWRRSIPPRSLDLNKLWGRDKTWTFSPVFNDHEIRQFLPSHSKLNCKNIGSAINNIDTIIQIGSIYQFIIKKIFARYKSITKNFRNLFE